MQVALIFWEEDVIWNFNATSSHELGWVGPTQDWNPVHHAEGLGQASSSLQKQWKIIGRQAYSIVRHPCFLIII